MSAADMMETKVMSSFNVKDETEEMSSVISDKECFDTVDCSPAMLDFKQESTLLNTSTPVKSEIFRNSSSPRFSSSFDVENLVKPSMKSTEESSKLREAVHKRLLNNNALNSTDLMNVTRGGRLSPMGSVGQSDPPTDESDEEMDKGSEISSLVDSKLNSPNDSFDKRGRVENLMSHMQNGSDCSETRRQKRKQFLPQQHANGDEPQPKVKKMETDNLRLQLKQMQHQLSQIQQRYMQLLDPEVEESNADAGNESSGEDEKVKSSQNNKFSAEREFQERHRAFIAENILSSHFSESLQKLSKNEEASKLSDLGLEKLAKLLKVEIRDVISNTVDTVVNKFINEQKAKNQQRLSAFSEAAIRSSLERSASPKNDFSAMRPTKPKLLEKNPFFHPHEHLPTGFIDTFHPIPAHHPFHPLPFFSPHIPPPPPHAFKKEPEQTEALPLVVNTPKKKRTKVTDTRLSPRAARALLNEGCSPDPETIKSLLHPGHHEGFPLVPVSLPTSVAIPNPSLQHSDVLSMYSSNHAEMHGYSENTRSPPIGDHMSPSRHTHSPEMTLPMMRSDESFMERVERAEREKSFNRCETPTYEASMQHMTSTLTPMHLRKAKLMFFFVRYPSSAILKVYFPDIKFNKNNTAQLVKWFSNFREFYYIQMEKYARQAIAEGVTNPEELTVSRDSELFRVLNLHYNRNNQIEVPESFRLVVTTTLREFYKSIGNGKDTEQSWKKTIYKIIARLDDPLPDYFKSSNWMEKLTDQ